jgi:AcrR family transcriptional regulator
MATDLNALLTAALADSGGAENPPTLNDARILDTTLDLVQIRGIDGFTVDDIAKKARLNRTTIFRRFGTKDEVLKRMITREIDNFRYQMAELTTTGKDGLTTIVECVDLAVTTGRTHPLARSLADNQTGWLIETLRSPRGGLLAEAKTLMATFIVLALTDHPNHDIAVDQIADLLLHLLIGYVFVPESALPFDDQSTTAPFTNAIVLAALRESDGRTTRKPLPPQSA